MKTNPTHDQINAEAQRPRNHVEQQGVHFLCASLRSRRLGVYFLLLVSLLHSSAATNDLSGQLQRGLFEEEANRNLDAAAQAYQTVSAQFDKDRKLAATAIFRLGEVYRKQNKTNEAVAQYERIVREFSDQQTLVTLSRQNLGGLSPVVTVTGLQKPIADEQEASRLAAQLNGIEQLKDNPEEQARAVLAFFPDETLKKMLLQLPKLKEQEAIVRENPTLPSGKLFEKLYQKLGSSPTANGSSYHTAYGPDGLEPERHGTNLITDAHWELTKQLAWIKERVAFTIGIQKARLQVLQAAVATTPGREGATGETPALTTDDQEKEIRRIQTMIQNSPDLINAPREGGYTPLGRAANAGWLRVAKFLLDHGAAIQQGGNNSTPLHLAAASGHRAMVGLLLERGAAIEARDGTGSTPLHIAAEIGFLSVAEVLVQHKANLEAENSKANGNQTPLERAAARGHVALVSFLAGKGAQFKGALSQAVVGGRTETLRKLLELGAKPDAEGASDSTALINAVERGNIEATKLLLAAKANPNLGKAKTPLVLAASGKNLEIAELLLKAGADPNRAGELKLSLATPSVATSGQVQAFYPKPGSYTYTPLQVAVAQGDVPMVKLLLANKADPNTKSHENSGWGSPVAPLTRWTLTNPEMLKALLDAGANANAEVFAGKSILSLAAQDAGAEAIELLLAAGAKPDVLDAEGESPLARAAARRCLPCVEALLKFKANPNLATERSGTALVTAVRANSTNIVAALLAAGADPNQTAWNGWSPVHSAVQVQNKAILTLLLAHKADPNVRASDGKTPLDLTKPGPASNIPTGLRNGAKAATLEELASILRRHGALEDLPDFKSIGVSRASAGYRATVFTKGTNDWNEYSLNELLLQQWGLLSLNLDGWWSRTRAGMNYETWGRDPLLFPDLSRVVIYRPEVGGKSRGKLEWNLVRIAKEEGRLQPVPLRFGDVVEVPEEDHPLSQMWKGPDEAMLDLLIKSVTRTVTVTVGGKATVLTLAPTFVRSAGSEYNRVCASFMVRSVLDESRLVRFSSDLTRVKVTRKAGPNGKAAEWVVDCSGKDQPVPDLWLRDGDVVEVPEKQ